MYNVESLDTGDAEAMILNAALVPLTVELASL